MAQQLTKPIVDLSGGSQVEMSYDEFRSWAGEDTLAEWVDGKVIELMPPAPRHQLISVLLSTVIDWFAGEKNLGLVFATPTEMRIRSGGSYRLPDLLFVNNGHLERVDNARLDGPADLVVEIVSPDSVSRDRRDK